MPSIYRCILSFNHLKIESNRKRFQDRDIVPYRYKKFEGIFSYLWKEADGSPVTKGKIKIEDTKGRSKASVSNLVDPVKRDQNDWYCVTHDLRNSAFIIEFKNKKVSFYGYSFKAHSRSSLEA